MNKTIKLEQGKYYHIYNRGIDGCDIFRETANYEHFLRLYDKYISFVASTFAWVLMQNHFHLLVQINLRGLTNLEGLKANLRSEERINKQFSNFFNAYTKAYNKRYHRTGSLFEHSFKRKQIDNPNYLKQVLLYIHNNPVHHGFCEQPIDYPWSSYFSCISIKPTRLQRDSVIGWFDSEANFKHAHKDKLNIYKIESFLEI
ncbi:MAG: hypothetical protein LBH82_05725 [Bacteroidales bacterium]|jgi:REP element-mobilizing transposase RayT|nr:hypothetical protein [Bacteroidales bacterium]